MDAKFRDIIQKDPWNEVFHVVFYPDRVYHAAYFNATRSGRYRYDVDEVRNAFDITVLKAKVYLDGVFLTNVLRIEYRAGRLTEVAREQDRLLPDQVQMYLRLLISKPSEPEQGPARDDIVLHFDPWIRAYQTEIWQSVAAPTRKCHDFRVLDQIGRNGPITSVFEFKELLSDLDAVRRLEVAFRERSRDSTFGNAIPVPQWDNNYLRSYQSPATQDPSSKQNTVEVKNYLIDFQRGYFVQNIGDVKPIRYRNAMMDGGNEDARDNNLIEMRWVVQREFSSSVVFFHEVTIPPLAIEGTHRHIGTEELYCVIEGEGVAYMGEGDDPANAAFPLVERQIMGFDKRRCRELKVQPGSVIFTKSGGIHGIRNNSPDKPLRFIAFLYHTS